MLLYPDGLAVHWCINMKKEKMTERGNRINHSVKRVLQKQKALRALHAPT